MRELSLPEIRLIAGGNGSDGPSVEETRRLETVIVTGQRTSSTDWSAFANGTHGFSPLTPVQWTGGGDGGGGVASLETVQSGRTDYDNCVTQQQGALDIANAQVQYWSEALEYYMTETVPDNSRVPGSGDVIETGLVFWAFNNYNAALATLNEVQARIDSCSGPGDA